MASLMSSIMGGLGFGGEGNKYKASDVYTGLRQMVFTTKPEKLGLTREKTPVYGVLMETGHKEAVVTLVCLADGTVSLYFSNGGGYIGVGQHQGPRQASDALISSASEYLSQVQKVNSYPLPNQGTSAFYILTFDGIYSAQAKESDLGNNKLPLSPLFFKAQDVITQLRLWDERRKAIIGIAARGEVANLKKVLEMDPVLIDAKDDTGLTPLMAAAYQGHTETVKCLLESKALVDVKEKDGMTALMFASNAGKLGCAQLLIDSGAKVEEAANDGSTAIMYAAQHGFNDVVKLLLERGADPNKKGKHGLSAVGFAKQNHLTETEKILLSRI